MREFGKLEKLGWLEVDWLHRVVVVKVKSSV